jgi:hypothetical protein
LTQQRKIACGEFSALEWDFAAVIESKLWEVMLPMNAALGLPSSVERIYGFDVREYLGNDEFC